MAGDAPLPSDTIEIANCKMILIPAGKFWMGSPDGIGKANERPQHRVWVDAFYMDEHPVTFDQYDRFCEDTRRRKVDDEEYCWERPISSQQAGFVMVSQCRDWLPDPVGGLYWYTPDDCYTTCFTPFYAGISRVPRSFTLGDIDRFSWDSAWWIYNFVSNLVYNRYSRIMPDVAVVQKEVEDAIFAMQPAVENTALQLHAQFPELAKEYLTSYSVSTAEGLVERWKELGEFILTKHNDGYVRASAEEGTVGVEYPEAWLRRLIKENPHQFKLPKWKSEPVE